jgi:hypothetical protein
MPLKSIILSLVAILAQALNTGNAATADTAAQKKRADDAEAADAADKQKIADQEAQLESLKATLANDHNVTFSDDEAKQLADTLAAAQAAQPSADAPAPVIETPAAS